MRARLKKPYHSTVVFLDESVLWKEIMTSYEEEADKLSNMDKKTRVAAAKRMADMRKLADENKKAAKKAFDEAMAEQDAIKAPQPLVIGSRQRRVSVGRPQSAQGSWVGTNATGPSANPGMPQAKPAVMPSAFDSVTVDAILTAILESQEKLMERLRNIEVMLGMAKCGECDRPAQEDDYLCKPCRTVMNSGLQQSGEDTFA